MIEKRVAKVKEFVTAKDVDERVLKHVNELKKEVKKQISVAILAAFGFIIALAWKDAIQEFVDNIITKFNIVEGSVYIYRLYTAIAITVVCVIGIIIITRWGSEKK